MEVHQKVQLGFPNVAVSGHATLTQKVVVWHVVVSSAEDPNYVTKIWTNIGLVLILQRGQEV